MRTETLEVRLTPEEKETLKAIAAGKGLPLSTWARLLLLSAAQHRHTIQLEG
jgi:antitoxin component of RelBE/YafQ-DinJ toxin-antitoxin module